MSLLVSSLILFSVVVSETGADSQRPRCHVPDGHFDGETVKYYDPEPRYGSATTVNNCRILLEITRKMHLLYLHTFTAETQHRAVRFGHFDLSHKIFMT